VKTKTKEADMRKHAAMLLLDSLEDESRSQDAKLLVSQIERICGCIMPQSEHRNSHIVEDIDEYVSVEDLNE
jgi:hypothetical protein